MHFLKILSLFNFLSIVQVFAQNTNEQLLGSTTLLTYTNNGVEKYGSGFVIFQETDKINHKGYHFLITNKHVIKEANAVIKIRFFRNNYLKATTKMELSIKLKDNQRNYLPKVRFNKNREDVVALDITEDYNKNQIEGQSLLYDWLATSEILKKNDISVGDEIYMIGYPDEIYDNRNYSPVFRYGIIASIPTENYNFNHHLQNKFSFPQTIPGFLIDANVVSGSSGSLVILKQQIGRVSNQSINFGSSLPWILGIVSKSIPIDDDVPSNIQRIGLGVVYSAQTIKDTIDFGIRLEDE